MTVVEKLNSCWIPDFEGRLDLWACLFLLKLLVFFKVKNSLSIPKSKLKPKDFDKILKESQFPTSQFFPSQVPSLNPSPSLSQVPSLETKANIEITKEVQKGKSQ